MDQEDESLFAEMLGHMSQAEIEALAAMDLDGETTSPAKKKKVAKKKTAVSAKPKAKKANSTAATNGIPSSAAPDASPAQPHTTENMDAEEAEDDFIEDLPEADRFPTSHKQSMRWGGTYTNLKDVFAGVVPADAWASGSAEMVSEALANLSIVNLTNHYSLPDTDLLMCLGKVTHLYLQGNGCIVDLSGLVVLVSLRVLSVAGNKVTSLEPLSTLDTLLLLDASDNQIEELDVGRDLPAGLQSLDLRGNPCAPLYESAKEEEITEDDIEYMHQYTDQVRTFCPKIRFLDGKTLTRTSSADEDDMEATGFLLNSVQNAVENGDDEMDPEMTSLREETGNDDDDTQVGHVQSSAMARRQKQLLSELLHGGSSGKAHINAATGHHSYLAPDREEGSDDDSTDDADGGNEHLNETANEASSRHNNRRDVVEDEDMERYQQRCGRVRKELDILQSHNGRAARLNLDNFWDSTMKSIDQLRGQVASRRTHAGLTSPDGSTTTGMVKAGGGGSGLNATPPGSPARQQRRPSVASATEPSMNPTETNTTSTSLSQSVVTFTSSRTSPQSATCSITNTDSMVVTPTSTLDTTSSISYGSTTMTTSASTTASTPITSTTTPTVSSQLTSTLSTPLSTSQTRSQATITSSASNSQLVSATRSGMTITGSQSASDSSRCGVLPYMIGESLMCIMTAAETPDEELLFRSCPKATATSNESSSSVSVWRLGTTQPAALVLQSRQWFLGQYIPKCLQIDQPLSLPSLSVITEGWANITTDTDFPMLVDVTRWMDSSARTGPFKVTISTTIQFFRVDATVPFGNITVEPNAGDSAAISAKRTILRMLVAFPDQRVGMYIHYAGSIDQKLANSDPAVFGYDIPLKGLGCESQLRFAQVSASTTPINTSTTTTFTGLGTRFQLNPPSSLLVDVTAAADDILDVLKKIGTVMSIVGMIPSVILALGIQNSIQSMSQCEGWWIPITLADGSTYSVIDVQSMIAGELDFLTSPFAIAAKAIGDVKSAWVGLDPQEEATSEARAEAELAIPQLGQYLRGAILTTVVMTLIFCLGVMVLVIIAWRARRLAGTDTLSTTKFPPNTSWWHRERQDLYDAAALIQVPSISIIGMSLLTDGVSQAGTTLLGMRISFMGDDGYSVVYRSLALEKGILPDLIFTTGTVEATGVAPIFWDMLIAVVGLVLMSVYCLHILYTTAYYPPIVLAPVDKHHTHIKSIEEAAPHQIGGGLEAEIGQVDGVEDHQHDERPPRIRITGSHSNSSDDLGLVLDEDDTTALAHTSKTVPQSSSSTIIRALKYLFEPELHFAAELPPDDEKVVKGADKGMMVDHNGDPTHPNINNDENDVEMDQRHQANDNKIIDPDDGDNTLTSPPQKRYTDGVRWISLYGLYVNGTIWAPYLCLEFSIAYVVTIMEGATSGSVPICSGKCIFALLLVGIQLVVLITKGPLGARFDQVTTVLAVGLTLVSGTLMTVGLMTNNSIPEVTIAASFVMISASLVVTVQGVVGMVAMLLSITATLKQILAYIRIRQERAAAARRKLPAEANAIDVDFEADFYVGGGAGELMLPIVENNSGSSNGSIFDSILGTLRASFGHGENAPQAYIPPATAEVPEVYENWKDFLDELEQEEQNLPAYLRRPPAAARRTRSHQAPGTAKKLDEDEMDDLNLLLKDDTLEVEKDFRTDKKKR